MTPVLFDCAIPPLKSRALSFGEWVVGQGLPGLVQHDGFAVARHLFHGLDYIIDLLISRYQRLDTCLEPVGIGAQCVGNFGNKWRAFSRASLKVSNKRLFFAKSCSEFRLSQTKRFARFFKSILEFLFHFMIVLNAVSTLVLTSDNTIVIIDCMDWKSLITELQAAGLSQQEIGRRLKKSQAWVSAAAAGKYDDLKWSDGEALRVLHLEIVGAGGTAPESTQEAA